MDNAAFLSLLRTMWPCPEAVEWVDGFTLRDAYQKCERGDWMLWIAGRMAGTPGWPTLQEVVAVAADIAETVLKYVPDSDERPAQAIATARRRMAGKATVEETRAAAKAAYSCSPAYALDYAASAAACVAYVASDLSHDAGAAVSDAALAIWVDAPDEEMAALARYADMVRAKLPCPDVGDTA